MSDQLLDDAAAYAKLMRIDASVAQSLATLVQGGTDPEELLEELLERALAAHDVSTPEAQEFLALLEPACRHAARSTKRVDASMLN